jgi:hypothetical protein
MIQAPGIKEAAESYADLIKQPISNKDLFLDEVMLRRIRRAQADEDRDHAEDDDEDGDGTDGEGDVSMQVTSQRNIKTEARSRGGRRRQVVEEVEDDAEQEAEAEDEDMNEDENEEEDGGEEEE